METFLVTYETAVRLGVFASLLAGFAALEAVCPRRMRTFARGHRWATNISISLMNSLTLRLAFPILAVGAAVWAQSNGWGVLNQTSWHWAIEFAIALIALDFCIYVQHLVMHHWEPLWRLHKVHHADVDIDVTTAVRFHPIEIGLSMVLKIFLVLLIGPSSAAVIAFEVILNGTSLFNHANIKMPTRMDQALRLVMVTPDMHRVHHSTLMHETNSNFGFNLSIWDRLCGTYRAQPENGHDAMDIGLSDYRDQRPSQFLWSLALPFLITNLSGGRDRAAPNNDGRQQ